MKLNHRLLNTILLVGLITGSYVQAQQLYKWVDAHGLTHYGDVLPDEHIEHEAFSFGEYQQQENPDDYYSIQNQLRRLQETRAETLKQKQQVAEIKAANNKTQEVVYAAPYEPQQARYFPAYLPYGWSANKFALHPKFGRYSGHHSKQINSQSIADNRPLRGIVSKPKASNSKAKKSIYSASR